MLQVAVSVGHTTTSLSTAVSAVQHGARLVTHLFNAMSAFHHRDPGLVGVLTSHVRDQIHYGIIVDGIHVHPTAVKMSYQTHPKGAVLVTDAMAALGLPPGKHRLGLLEVEVVMVEKGGGNQGGGGGKSGRRSSSSSSSYSSSSSSSSSYSNGSSSNGGYSGGLYHNRHSSLNGARAAKDNAFEYGHRQKKAVLASDRVTLAGSVASMDECVRNYIVSVCHVRYLFDAAQYLFYIIVSEQRTD